MGWERRGPGGLPRLQNEWRGARRRAVGSTPMRPRHAAYDPGMRPPSVDAVIRAANGALTGRDHAAVVAEARRVVAEERERLANGGQAPTVELLAARRATGLRPPWRG